MGSIEGWVGGDTSKVFKAHLSEPFRATLAKFSLVQHNIKQVVPCSRSVSKVLWLEFLGVYSCNESKNLPKMWTLHVTPSYAFDKLGLAATICQLLWEGCCLDSQEKSRTGLLSSFVRAFKPFYPSSRLSYVIFPPRYFILWIDLIDQALFTYLAMPLPLSLSSNFMMITSSVNWCLPLTSGNHRVPAKGFFQSTLETLQLLWELKGKSASPHEAIRTLLLGSWQVKVIAWGWMRCNSLDTIPPNGIKVAQCAPLLHQRDIPTLVKPVHGSILH